MVARGRALQGVGFGAYGGTGFWENVWMENRLSESTK